MTEQLAINGGASVRQTKLFYGRQWITEEDAQAVKETMLSDYITCGPQVDAAEKHLCEYTGARHAVVVANGTAALHAACAAAGLKAGDEVITTPLTFMASANAALYVGARPVFADIDEKTYNIDPASIEAHITDKTKAVVAVDYTGQAVDLDAIRDICNRHHLTLIEDAAHSIGTSYNGKKIGSVADITCFSFHPVKTVTAGEGGAVLTNDDDLYHRIALFRGHGIEREPALMEETPEGIWVYEQQMLGYNYRMTDFQAALLISQMKRLDAFSARRKEIVKRYDEAFQDVPELTLQQEIPQSDTTRHLYVIQLNLEKLSCTRAEFFNAMSAENVQCQVHYIPVYYSPYYQSLGYKKGLCPKAERLYERIMSIPLYPKMTDEDVEDVITAVKKVVAAYRK